MADESARLASPSKSPKRARSPNARRKKKKEKTRDAVLADDVHHGADPNIDRSGKTDLGVGHGNSTMGVDYESRFERLTLKAGTTRLEKKWRQPASQGKGGKTGAHVDGTVVGTRQHTIEQRVAGKTERTRYFIVVLDVRRVRRRVFAEDGVELLPDAKSRKMVYTQGHLNKAANFKKTEAYEAVVDSDTLLDIIGGSALTPGVYDEQLERLHPNVEDRFEFWGDVDVLRPKDLKRGDKVRLICGRTHWVDGGAGALIKVTSETKRVQVNQGAGAELGDSWTNRMHSALEAKAFVSTQESTVEGVDESEWD